MPVDIYKAGSQIMAEKTYRVVLLHVNKGGKLKGIKECIHNPLLQNKKEIRKYVITIWTSFYLQLLEIYL